MPSAARRLGLRRRLLFAAIPLLALLFLGEVLIRLFRAPLHFGSFRELRLDLLARNYPAQRDPMLGYSPQPGFSSRDNHWGTQVTIDADGMRTNGRPAPPGDRIVATVGDSFTFGDQVDDDATWPAQLEALLGRPVKNGGVFGYSLTQAVLRGEAMLDRFPVDTLIVSLIPDDLARCEYEKRYTPVPWFEITGDEIVLRNVPVPLESEPDASKRWKDFLGHSALVDAVLANTCRQWWFENEKQVRVEALRGRGGELGQKLIDRIDAKCRTKGVRLLVVLQDKKPDGPSLALLRHAEARGVRTLDLASAFEAMAKKGPGEHDGWFDGHMTRAGNRWVAERIAAALAESR